MILPKQEKSCMKNEEYVNQWLKRAQSNLERARLGKVKKEILFEDLCFDCQQCVEKAFKALLICLDKEFPPTHSIAKLFEFIAETKTEVPEEFHEAIELTDYAVATRYPGRMEMVTEDEFRKH